MCPGIGTVLLRTVYTANVKKTFFPHLVDAVESASTATCFSHFVFMYLLELPDKCLF